MHPFPSLSASSHGAGVTPTSYCNSLGPSVVVVSPPPSVVVVSPAVVVVGSPPLPPQAAITSASATRLISHRDFMSLILLVVRSGRGQVDRSSTLSICSITERPSLPIVANSNP